MSARYDFHDRTALITGGAGGIGVAVARMLLSSGARIAVCAAGVSGDSLATVDVGDDEWHRVFSINYDGVFFTNRAAARVMAPRGYGRIVNIASIAGKEGNPMAAAYSASKAAVIAMTKSILASEECSFSTGAVFDLSGGRATY
jgi:NAD(P)-dependent dehydrogenase (short-subunit alcohol dehydrogenase family)